ncbi:MAG: decarboxylating 6-phosphogluconate dehydrogenase [Candidatus Zixiibacteriota bacterium]
MKLGFIGLGKMGANMVTRLRRDNHEIVIYARSQDAIDQVAKATGAIPSSGIAELVSKLPSPKVVWVMVTSGAPTEQVITDVAAQMKAGDIIIDGGNSNFHDTRRRYEMLKERGISFLDAGTSGGVWGLKVGYCQMIGGDEAAFKATESLYKTLAPKDGYLYVGPSGSGHYVKMVHNGIEYGMMQAYAEGFEILKASEYNIDLAKVSHLWNQGSVVRSWLLELAERAFEVDPKLDGIKGYVADSGEGRWTVQEAIDRDVPAVVLTYALMARFRSRQEDSFGNKVLAALRNQFGGHEVKKA